MTVRIETSELVRTFQSRRNSTTEVIRRPDRNKITLPPLTLEGGGIVAIIGKSGTGKTTLLRLLGGLDRPDKGSIRLTIDDRDFEIVAWPEKYPRSKVGFVFQEGILFDNVPVGLNIALPAVTHGVAISDSRIASLIHQVGLPPEIDADRRAWELSGGQAQRVAVARAIAHDPVLLFADEPTSSLDEASSKNVLRHLKDWAGTNRMVIWVTHDLDLALEFADRVIAMPAPLADDEATPAALVVRENPKDLETLRHWLAPEGFGQPAAQTRATDPLPSAVREASDNLAAAAAASGIGRSVCGIALRFAIAEMLARRPRRKHRQGESAPDIAGTSGTSRAGSWWRTLRTFSDGTRFAAFLAALTILSLLFAGGQLCFRMLDEELADPRNCHVVVTGSVVPPTAAGGAAAANARALPLNDETVAQLRDRRAWEGVSRAVEPNVASGYEFAPADCQRGDGAFGRRDFRPWEIGLVRAPAGSNPAEMAQSCQGLGLSYRLMVTMPNEPLLRVVRVVERPPTVPATFATLTDYYEAPGLFPEALELFVTSIVANALYQSRADGSRVLPDRVCLMDAVGGEARVFRLLGVIDQLPAPRLSPYELFMTESTYQTLAEGNVRGTFSQVVFYFSPENIGRVRQFLRENGLQFIPDNLNLLESKIRQFRSMIWIISIISVAFALFVMVVVDLNVKIFILSNGKSLAAMKAFGVMRSFLMALIVFRQLILVVLSIAMFYAVFLGLQTLGLTLSGAALGLNEGIEPMALLESGFRYAAPILILLVILICNREVRAWWKRHLYVAELLR